MRPSDKRTSQAPPGHPGWGPAKRPGSRLWVNGLAALFLLFATGFGYLGTQGPGPSASSQQNALPAVRMRAIETYGVCDRVLGENPELTAEDRAKFGAEPDPATWKKLELRCPKRDGSWADVAMVQPPSWLEEQRARAGGTVEISVPECGIEGHAQVLSIGPCPPVKRGQGHVVTATFRHHAVSTVHLRIEGSTEPIRCTGNHPFWSEDRRQFVRADALKIGEHLSSLHGPTALVSRTDQSRPKPVFNIQVQGTHVYLVGADGVLVHNGVVCQSANTAYEDAVAAAQQRYPNLAGKMNDHHIEPKYLGGAADGETVSLDRAYHQVITNAFRRAWKYGTGKLPSVQELQKIGQNVYGNYPLPPKP